MRILPYRGSHRCFGGKHGGQTDDQYKMNIIVKSYYNSRVVNPNIKNKHASLQSNST